MVKVALLGQHQQSIVEVSEATDTITTLDGSAWVRDGVYYPPSAGATGATGPFPPPAQPIPRYRPIDLTNPRT